MLDPSRSALQRYFDEVASCDVPTKEQEQTWFKAYAAKNKEDRVLKGKIAKGYLRFVIKKARERTQDDQKLMDLIGTGNIGLMKAIDKFDVKYKTRFLTYATFWIEVEMQGYLNSRLVHVPHQTIKDQRQVKRREDREMALGTRDQYSFTEVTTTSYERVVLAAPEVEVEEAPDAALMMQHLIGAQLGQRERLILTFYYGLRGGTARTLDEITSLLFEVEGRYLTRETVRKMKEDAFARLTQHLRDTGVASPWSV